MAILSGVDLKDADLRGANLYKADLTDANLAGAKLDSAVLVGTILRNADLDGASLIETNLQRAELEGAHILRTNMRNARFEPTSLPNARAFVEVNNLKTLTYRCCPSALYKLRSSLRSAGMKSEEREVTHAIMFTKYSQSSQPIRFIGYAVFGLPTEWGLQPFRPLLILCGLIGVFWILYSIVICAVARCTLIGGIRRLPAGGGKAVIIGPSMRGFGIALYFSVMCAFYFGWRDINLAKWIARLSPNEDEFRAYGWTRTISGIQSILSLLLIALWGATYFGTLLE